MSTARNDVLGRIRRSIEPSPASREQDYAAISRQYRQAGVLDRKARLDLFQSRLEDYGCGCVRCGEEGVAGTIERLLTARGSRTLVVPVGLPPAWLPGGFAWQRDKGLRYSDLDDSDGAVTGCSVAIAQTGSIVLCHGASEGRRALTLIPDYHLCVVFANQVVETVPEAWRQPQVAASMLITTISGPSATADIEMTRIKGVHGPRTLDVVLVDV